MPQKEIEALSHDVYAHVTIEELEQRLEIEILKMPEATLCIWHCDVQCDQRCGVQTPDCMTQSAETNTAVCSVF